MYFFMYDLIISFISCTQPKPSANISTDTEWQSNTAHWYACEEALLKLIVSSAKAGSSGWSKQVGVKVLVWKGRCRDNSMQMVLFKQNQMICFKWPLPQLTYERFYYRIWGVLIPSFSCENDMILIWYQDMCEWGTSPIRKVKSENLQKTFS